MSEKELLDWCFYNVDGYPQKEWDILKIALCQKYQENYSDIQTMCLNAGLPQDAAEAVKRWKYHNQQADTYILNTLYDYLVYKERERFLKSLHIYYKQNS